MLERCELCGESCAGEDGRPCVMPESMGAGVGGQTLMLCEPCYDRAARFDISDLSGDTTPCSIAEFLEANPDADPAELDELRACEVGGSVYLGIGGGAVRVWRVA